MARCHRIGQEKEVTVYRLVSKDTYEEQLFNTASRKYGERGTRERTLVQLVSATTSLPFSPPGLLPSLGSSYVHF